MAFKDILLQLDSYPDAASADAIDKAARLCALLGEAVTAVAVHLQIPLKSNRGLDFSLGFGDVAREEERRSLGNAQTLLSQFTESASKAGIRETGLVVKSALIVKPDPEAD